MALTELTVITEAGQEEVVTLSDKGFSINLGGAEKSPVITTEIERDYANETEQVYDQCGNFESKTTANKGVRLTVTGICTSNNSRRKNLAMQDIRDDIENMDTIEIACDLFDGPIKVRGVILRQVSDTVYVAADETEGKEFAYEFEFTLGEERGQN